MVFNIQKSLSDDKATRDYLMTIIRKGSMIPVISNSFSMRQIFRDEIIQNKKANGLQMTDDTTSAIDKSLTKQWASMIEYPLQDKYDLARVAQYWQVENNNEYRSAKEDYLYFLKVYFLDHAEKVFLDSNSGNATALKDMSGLTNGEIQRLKNKTDVYSFSQLVADQLSYPRLPAGVEDPLRLLAKLDLPIYITTSHFDFLERAIRSESEGKKEPRTQVCFWGSSVFDIKPEHKLDPDFTPSKETPAVYHLYGLEDYPESLVLSEDDYLNFLISMFENTNTLNPLIPSKLRLALARSPLLLLGYQLNDWDFRVLFRFFLKFRQIDSQRGLIIQLNPTREGMEKMDKSVEYLNHYFNKEKFNLFWENAEIFIQELYEVWKKNR